MTIRRYNQQPQYPAQIDRSNALGARVVAYLPLNTAAGFGTGGTVAVSVKGRGLRGSGGSARASFPLDLSSKNKITVAFWMYWDSFANDDALAMEFGSVYTVDGFLIDPNASGAQAGMFLAGVGSSAGSNLIAFARPTGAAWHRIALAFDRSPGTVTSTTAWVDGIRQSATLPFSQTVTGNFGNNTLNLFSRNGSSLLGTGNLQDITIYDGIFSDTDAASDYANPWQILKAPPRPPLFAPPSAGTTVTYDGSIVADWSRTIAADAPVPADWAASRSFDGRAPIAWGATVLDTETVAVELRATVLDTDGLPVEWSGGVSVSADARMPVEWRISMNVDAAIALDWLALRARDDVAATAWGATVLDTETIAAAWASTVRADGAMPVDWSGSVAVSADARVPIEWAGGVSVMADARLPIEFGGGVAATSTLPLNWSAAVVRDVAIPADWGRGIVADQTAAVEWLRAIFGDAVIPGATLLVLQADTRVPVEFGGASQFRVGNTEIFRVDARGVVWHVEARSTIWHIPPR